MSTALNDTMTRPVPPATPAITSPPSAPCVPNSGGVGVSAAPPPNWTNRPGLN